ncbi:MAG: sigma factor, partial [Mangrovibacterium sp.]|nr:sigma factor [Mangrovibacterium sp.]
MPEDYPVSNEYLLSELQSGQERAFDYLFRSYYKALCAQAVSYVSELDTAHGLVQDCFVKLWEKRADLAAVKNLNAYLSLMVRNHCIDYLRKERAMEKLHRKSQADQASYTTGE